MELYKDTLTTKFDLRIDEIEFNSSTKIEGKVAAGMSVFVNGSKVYHLADLGYFKTKSGRYVWNQWTAARQGMMPANVSSNVTDQVTVKITLQQTKGIPFINKENNVLHS